MTLFNIIPAPSISANSTPPKRAEREAARIPCRIWRNPPINHGAIEGGEEATPDGEASADPGSVHAYGLRSADKASALGRAVDAFEEVEGGAPDGAHAEGAADVVEYAIWAGFAGGLWGSHPFVPGVLFVTDFAEKRGFRGYWIVQAEQAKVF
ncbi:3-hydroxyacyl-[acyl-carrier-protein] dehydratase FabZ [Striga asiatica]|uniref:3-hydroxyacyl-[acyl-carrier-protein] dehydratase FabZ n=1 Tax=Striga asiatica TaxID=4170 RepID=A0A5A7QVZ6_STRAF|nr:3-hydroxyacyl-[acyl-carrier-protein] dehydratase FabZ [Striga asiatica]